MLESMTYKPTHLKSALTGALGAVAMTILFASPAHAASEKIIYNDWQHRIIAINPDGTGKYILGIGDEPKLSPDGKQILFNGYAAGQLELYTMATDGTNVKLLTGDLSGSQGYGNWSPDGSKIAYFNNVNGVYGMYTMNSDGTNPKKFSWTPSIPRWLGAKLVFEDETSTGTQIATINSDGTDLVYLTTGNGGNRSPVGSPDGSRLAWRAAGALTTMKPDGSDKQIIVPAPAGSGTYDIDWSPDSSMLVYPDNGGLTKASVDQRTTEHLQVDNNGMIYPDWGKFDPPSPIGIDAPALTAWSPTNQPLLTWTSVAGAVQYSVFRDGGFVGTTSDTSYVDSDSLGDASYSYTVVASDVLGNVSEASMPVVVVVDTTVPILSSLGWTSNPLMAGQPTTLSATTVDARADVSRVQYRLDNGSLQSMTYDPGTNSWKAILGSTLVANTYVVDVVATDYAGNISAALTDILVVYNAANGYLVGHEWLTPTTSDVLPIVLDAPTNTNVPPAKMVIGLTNVKSATASTAASGSFDVQYVIKQNRDEFSLSSTQIDWLVIADATHASVLGHADLVKYVAGVMTVVKGVSVRMDLTLGGNGSADRVSLKVYEPGVSSPSGTPSWMINEPVDARQSRLMIKQ
jgi:hypothetical protein